MQKTNKKLNNNNKTDSNCYSITIRTGNGINLGSNPVMQLLSYLRKSAKYFIISKEMEDENAHFQGGVFYESSKRQDNLRRDILSYAEQIYLDSNGDKPITEKGLQNMRKYSVKVVPHNDWDILVRYTLKEGVNYATTPVDCILPADISHYVPEQFCIHDNVKFYCSTCYKEESDEVTYIAPPEYKQLFENYPSLKKVYEKGVKKFIFFC